MQAWEISEIDSGASSGASKVSSALLRHFLRYQLGRLQARQGGAHSLQVEVS